MLVTLWFQIQVIENINHLTELRVLNLAGNRITFVDSLIGMMSLAELNLRRNHIKSLVCDLVVKSYHVLLVYSD